MSCWNLDASALPPWLVESSANSARIAPFSTTTQPKVKVRRKANQTYLPKRCFRCQAERAFLVGARRYGLLTEEGGEHCSHNGCGKPLFHGTKFCEAHFYAWQPTVGLEASEGFVELERRLNCAITAKWKASPEMKKFLRLFDSIRAGDTLPSKLMFLDLEFNTKTRKLYEVGMCDANGVITMDCLTKYSPGAQKSSSANPDRQTAYIDQLIQNSTQNHNCRDGRMTARQIADRLKEQGVTPDTLIVTWHHYAADLSALRDGSRQRVILAFYHGMPNASQPFRISVPTLLWQYRMMTSHFPSACLLSSRYSWVQDTICPERITMPPLMPGNFGTW